MRERRPTPGGVGAILLLLTAVLLGSAGCGGDPPQEEVERPPNIVLIVADDLGWTDLGAYGGEFYETPNLDELAREGIRFTQAYANPNCAPTRAALLTGRYSPRTGIYTVNSGARGEERFRKMIPAENVTQLALEEVTFAEVLQEAGYRTAHLGKWHMGSDEHGPTGQGFDFNLAGNQAGHPESYFSPFHNPDLPDGPEGQNLTDRLASEAAKWIRLNADDPFLLYLPFYAVHTPIQGKPALVEKYRQKPPAGGHSNAEYAAMVETLAQGVGLVLLTLEDLGIADDTVVLFYSDNGGLGGYADAGVEVAREVTDNAPLRGGKGMLYEGGVRVPLIVRYPGVTPPGVTTDEPVMCVDLFPTLLEIAGVDPPADRAIDGTSFVDLLRGRNRTAATRPAIYWHFPGYLQGRAEIGAWRTTPRGAIRDGRYKLIEDFTTGELELYNLEQDLSERNNLATVDRARAEELRAKLAAWRERLDAPMPREK